MKFVVTFKDPDSLYDEIDDNTNDKVEAANAKKYCVAKWFKYGEYVSIEIDTEEGTARVLTNSEYL